MILVAVVVLVGVFFAATGRGGELSHEPPDYAPLDLGPVSAADVALLRPPTALWGYNVPVTDEALERIARAMRERDITIAYLQQQLADATAQTGPLPGIPRAHLPQRIPPADQDDPAGPPGPTGPDDPAGPAAAPAAEEQNR
jgi:hypothetical protein